VYHASHDMRAPLRSLIGLQQVILEETSIEEIHTCAQMMQRSTEKLDNLIEDLLVLARSKKSEARITSIDFDHELQDCLSQLKFLQNIDKIHIQGNITQEHTFHSDAVRLRIILNNIITNAIKYHKVDQPTPFIHINIAVNPQKASLTISDNGPGIEQKHLAKIFDMFYRATNATEGTGLGLYLVKQTIEKLEGTISVSSTLNEGTTFTVEIPNVQSTHTDLVMNPTAKSSKEAS
ncbi:MAG TPA: HAMP domain-containing sensor histidine kinase, partial [Cytophagales bacterium]|nr:HAMP domain-containing sensor histidine kinase [Cytophagales bacterium]